MSEPMKHHKLCSRVGSVEDCFCRGWSIDGEGRPYAGGIEVSDDPGPQAHKSIYDYQAQLRAKRKRVKK